MNTCSSMMIQAQKLKDLRCCLECAIARMLEIRCYLVSPASSPPQHASQNAGAYPLSHPHHAYTHVRKCKSFRLLEHWQSGITKLSSRPRGSTLCVGMPKTMLRHLNLYCGGPVCGRTASPVELHVACR